MISSTVWPDGNHRQHVLHVGDLDVEHEGAWVLKHFVQGGVQVRFLVHSRGSAAIPFGDRHEIRIRLGSESAQSVPARFRMVDRAQVGVSAIAGHEPIFPLHDHAQVLVIEQQHFHRQVFAVAGGQFLDVHLEAAVAIDIDDDRVGMSGLSADSRRQSEPHRAQPGTGEPRAWRGEFVVLSDPHLMLPHTRRDDRLPVVCLIPQFRDGMLLQNAIELLVVVERIFGLPLQALIDPGGNFFFPRTDDLLQFGQGVLDVADNRNVRGFVLVQLRGIDVDVHDLGMLGKRLQFAGHAIVKPHADRQQQITIAHGMVSIHAAMHAEHVERQGVGVREGARVPSAS